MATRPPVKLRRGSTAASTPLVPRLTARQQQILDWIRSFIESRGMPPTRAEIAAGLGFSTASSAEDHLQALAKKGAIKTHFAAPAEGLYLTKVLYSPRKSFPT